MAESVLVGISGSVTGLSNRLFSWQGTFHTDALDSTGFGTNGYRTRELGLRDGRGRAVGYLTTGSSNASNPLLNFNNNSKVTNLVLTSYSGCTITMASAVISDVELGVEVDRLQTVSFSWESDGTIAEVWA